MAIDKIFNCVYRIRNCIVKNIQFPILLKKNPEMKSWLNMNREFRNIHLGKRCFILGNGPSLKNENLKLLNGEYIFTVNQVNRLSVFDQIKTNFHFWVDGNFFNVDISKPEDRELLEVMSSIGQEYTTCFFPIEQLEFCRKYGLMDKLNVRFFASKPRLIFHENYSKNIDFRSVLPGFGTVVQYCICMAIYMGFSKIYLLGCDNTGIMVSLKSALKKNDSNDYAYGVSENEKKRMEGLLHRNSIEQYAIDYAQTLTAYRRLYNYCKARQISITNCSSSTVIDSIPRKSLEEVIALENGNEIKS